MYSAHETGLDELWKDTRAGLGSSVAIDRRGEHAVASYGSSVLIYDAVHKLTASLPSQTQDSGTAATYTVSYRNDGNRVEDVSLSATPPAGVTVSLAPTQFDLAVGASREVTVTVTLPATRAPGTTSIPLEHKLSNGLDGTGTSTLAISVPTKHDLRLEAVGPASLGVQPGGVATFQVMANNAGNVQESGNLALTGIPSGWSAEVSPTSLALAPGASLNLTVSATPPSTAPHLAQADLVLQRTGGPTLALTATVGAGFGTTIDGPRGATLAPGQSQLLNFTVKNTGNAPDTLLVRLGNLPSGWQVSFLTGLSEHRLEGMAAKGSSGDTTLVQATIRAPVGSASSVAVQFVATAQSLADPTKTDSHLVLLTVEEPVESETSSTTESGGGGDNGIPGVPPLLLALALVGLGLLARRKASR